MTPETGLEPTAMKTGNSTTKALMRVRFARINDLPIKESDRKYHWPLGRRPDDHPGLSDLGL
jgi:nuclear transport factor 2 (NTF2) superfamily protein